MPYLFGRSFRPYLPKSSGPKSELLREAQVALQERCDCSTNLNFFYLSAFILRINLRLISEMRPPHSEALAVYTLDACSALASSLSPYGSCVAACPFPLTQLPPDARISPASANAAVRAARTRAYPLAELTVLIAHAPAYTMPADASPRTTSYFAGPVPTLGSLKSTPTPRGQLTGALVLTGQYTYHKDGN
jgi:hypothetical protein